MIEAGRVVDRYCVEREIGAGGMATVYRVRHQTLGSQHALKVLKLHGEHVRERLVQEGRVQATLRHPNIVEVTDVIDVDGAPGLVMEYIDGPPLDVWMRNRQPDLATAERIFRGILGGVARAHRAGLVHRDLKPGNVLLATGDDGFIPKVTDFGLAKIMVEEEGSSPSRTRSGVAMGTPAYMSPEQVRDTKSVDQRADIFALGCIFYELLVGRAPFERPDMLQTFHALASGEYDAIDTLVPNLPVRVTTMIACCLQVDREKRPPDCAAVRRLLDGEAPSVVLGRSPSSPAVGTGVLAEAERAGLRTIPVVAETPYRPAAATTPPPADSLFLDEVAPPVRTWGWMVGVLGFAGVVGFVAVIGLAWLLWPKPEPVAPEPARTTEAPRVEVKPAEVVAAETPPQPAPEPVVEPVVEPVIEKPPAEKPPVEKPAEAVVTPPPVVEPPPPVVEAPPPAEEKPVNGKVALAGDAKSVTLQGASGSFGPGAVPPGEYKIRAEFEGKGVVGAGTLTVNAGQTVTLYCDAAFAKCRPR